MPENTRAREVLIGSHIMAVGSLALIVGARLKPQTPERLIVRAARAIRTPACPNGVCAYASYQPGGEPTLPSIVFFSTGVNESDQFHRNLVSQEIAILVRAKRYDDVIEITDLFYDALRQIAGSRFEGVSGQWSDSFQPSLNYRERAFSVTIRR